MLYSILLHLLAGAVAGSVFKVRTLLVVVGLVLLETLVLVYVHGGVAVLWALASLVGVQAGYLFGIYVRGALEQIEY